MKSSRVLKRSSSALTVMADAAERRDSHGSRLYAAGGIRGIRGEAAAGFPHARRAAERLAAAGDPVRVLLEVMAELEDTNVLHRGGEPGAAWLKKEAARIAALPPSELHPAVLALDAECIRRNISPGGAADVLATAMFLQKIAPYWQEIIAQEEDYEK